MAKSKNNGSNLGRVAGTVTVWAGIAGLSYLFNSFGILSGGGAIGLVFVALMLTAAIWKIE